MMILGIDVGGSTTKIVGVEDGQIRSAQSIVDRSVPPKVLWPQTR